MDNPQDLNPVSVKRAENEVKDAIDLESQDDIKQTSFFIINEIRKNLDTLEKKIDGGALDGYQRPNLTARRIGILDVIREVIEKMTNNIKGGYTIDHDKGKVVDDEPLSPIPPDPDDLGYGYGATHHALDSVKPDPSKLTEAIPALAGALGRAAAAGAGYRVIKRRDDEENDPEQLDATVQDTFAMPPSELPTSAVEPDIEDDEQLISAYYELVNSLNDRIEDMDETSKEIHIQTGKKDSPAITVQVLGFKKDPTTTAAKKQEDAVGYESYMQHSTANPKRFG